MKSRLFSSFIQPMAYDQLQTQFMPTVADQPTSYAPMPPTDGMAMGSGGGGRTGWIIVGIIFLLLLIGGGVALYFLLRPKPTDKDE